MHVTMMLADAVQASEGKLYILGGGWNITGPDPSPFGIAVLFSVPWDAANRRHEFEISLLDEDGEPVALDDTGAGVTIGGEFEVGRPPGVRSGTPLAVPIAINSGPLPLPPGRRYVWRLTVNGEDDETWRLPFDVRPAS